MQHPIFRSASVVVLSIWLLACSKQKFPPGTASLNIVNAVPGSAPLITRFQENRPFSYYTANNIYYKRFNRFSGYDVLQPLLLYPFPDTLATSMPMFRLQLELPLGSISTLMLTGTVEKPDTVFLRDQLPAYAAADSATGLRFVNLSAGSGPVNIRIKGKPGSPEVANLAYKNATVFKIYPVNNRLPDYVFEFRDAATDALIASFTTVGVNYTTVVSPHTWLYQNFTIALVGFPGGAAGREQSVISIPY